MISKNIFLPTKNCCPILHNKQVKHYINLDWTPPGQLKIRTPLPQCRTSSHKAYYWESSKWKLENNLLEIHLGEKSTVLVGLMSHFFNGSIFSFYVQVKLFLQFFLFHINLLQSKMVSFMWKSSIWNYWMANKITNRIIYFVIFFKVSFLPGDDVDVDMWNCLASLRTILISTNSYHSGTAYS